MKTRPVEICAPAGSMESLAAAIRAGADSIYFGVGNLNMRSRAAANFAVSDISDVVKKCHKSGLKAYLALNCIVYDEEIESVRQLCEAAKTAGVDAVIASDFATIMPARALDLPVHISVQSNIANIESVRFHAQFADVMILARELSLIQIQRIIDAIEKEHITGPSGNLIRIELFAHGALCVAVSGKCYMSLAQYQKSANRGACYQPCRRAYRVTDEQTGEELVIDNKFVMSPKDICSLPFLDKILDAGVSILKLEGRGRSADYVNTIVGVYREAVDAWRSENFPGVMMDDWMRRLERVFNRGFWQGGYYLGKKLGEWCESGDNQSSIRKLHVGEIDNYYSKIGVASINLLADSLAVGDEILIIGPTTGALEMTVKNMHFDDKIVNFAAKGTHPTIQTPQKVRKKDKVYRLERRVNAG